MIDQGLVPRDRACVKVKSSRSGVARLGSHDRTMYTANTRVTVKGYRSSERNMKKNCGQ